MAPSARRAAAFTRPTWTTCLLLPYLAAVRTWPALPGRRFIFNPKCTVTPCAGAACGAKGGPGARQGGGCGGVWARWVAAHQQHRHRHRHHELHREQHSHTSTFTLNDLGVPDRCTPLLLQPRLLIP